MPTTIRRRHTPYVALDRMPLAAWPPGLGALAGEPQVDEPWVDERSPASL